MNRCKKSRVTDIIIDDGETAGPSALPQESKNICFPVREVNITDLPNEALAVVFRFFSYQEVAIKLRPVCRQFCNVATLVLNSGVATLGLKIDRAMLYIEAGINLVQNNQDLLGMSRCFNALEIMKYQFLLLRAVTWRYVCNPFTGSVPLACFYAGQLLDDFLYLLELSRQSPKTFYHYRNRESSDIGKLCDHCKTFMSHFERVTEKKINVHYSLSGCKIVDLLDCLVESDTRVPRYKYADRTSDEGDCHIKAHYRIKKSWFTCVETQDDREYTWKDEQRFMYMRLRRLIASNNDLVLEQLHHERRTLVQQPAFPGNLLPSTYSGYGGYGGFFFYYGNMNDSAYEEKFGSRRLSSDDDSDNQSSKPESPCLDLDFYVDIECPLELAPIDYLDKYHKPDLECRYNSMIRSMRDSEHTFQLKLSIYCPASFENRLPFMFTWSISSDNFQKLNLCDFRSDGYCSVPVDVSDTEPEITAGSVVPEPWKLSVL